MACYASTVLRQLVELLQREGRLRLQTFPQLVQNQFNVPRIVPLPGHVQPGAHRFAVESRAAEDDRPLLPDHVRVDALHRFPQPLDDAVDMQFSLVNVGVFAHQRLIDLAPETRNFLDEPGQLCQLLQADTGGKAIVRLQRDDDLLHFGEAALVT